MANSKSWLKQAVIYNLLIDRFARGHDRPWLATPDQPVFCGGDLQGVIDKLDYLQDLGVTTILLTPFHPSPYYHGYHVLDFFGIDKRFGNLKILKTLLAEAHARGLHVIMDFVLSHVSHLHPYFQEAQANPRSPYRDWFLFTEWPHQYLSFLNFYELPKLNLSNPEVKEHLFEVARYWLDLGFDGLRLDHIIGIPHRFLNDLHGMVTNEYPDAVLIGEAVKGKIRWHELKTLRLHHKVFLYLWGQLKLNTTFFMQLQYTKKMDGVFDFFFRDMTKSFSVKRAWYKPWWLLRLILKVHQACYPKTFALISLLDNADHDRFSFLLAGHPKRLHRALQLQFSQPQPVLIYYGSEAGVPQTSSRKFFVYGDKPNGDLAVRQTMPWHKLNKSTVATYKRLIKNRRRADV